MEYLGRGHRRREARREMSRLCAAISRAEENCSPRILIIKKGRRYWEMMDWLDQRDMCTRGLNRNDGIKGDREVNPDTTTGTRKRRTWRQKEKGSEAREVSTLGKANRSKRRLLMRNWSLGSTVRGKRLELGTG